MVPSLIIVAGPAGGGKTTHARKLAEETGYAVVHTDDWKDSPWSSVPKEVKKVVEAIDRPLILEGVRALSCVFHNGWGAIVEIVWWCDHGPGRDGCEGLETRQRRLVSEMGMHAKLQRPPRFEQ